MCNENKTPSIIVIHHLSTVNRILKIERERVCLCVYSWSIISMNWPFLCSICIMSMSVSNMYTFWDYILRLWFHVISFHSHITWPLSVSFSISIFFFYSIHKQDERRAHLHIKCLNFIAEIALDTQSIVVRSGLGLFGLKYNKNIKKKFVAYTIEWNENRGNLLTNQSKTVSSGRQKKINIFPYSFYYTHSMSVLRWRGGE